MRDFENKFENHAQFVAEAEETLRQVAQQPAPEGLPQRVHKRLQQDRAHQRRMLASEPERRGFWRLWLPAHRLQFAGAAVIAAVIAVSTLSVRHSGSKAAQAPAPVPVQSGTFGTSAAQGHPASLKPIPVPAQAKQTKKKKPSAGHSAKHAAKKPAANAASAATVAP